MENKDQKKEIKYMKERVNLSMMIIDHELENMINSTPCP